MDEQVQRKIIGEVQYRTVSLNREAINQENRTVALSFSSEIPVERFWGMEILDHRPECVRMGRLLDGAPLLWNHDPDEHIGTVESATIDADRVGRAVVRFSRGEDAEEKLSDVADGILKKVSVGYIIHKMVLDSKEGEVETYRAVDWEPIEITLTSLPADNTVGVGRNHETHKTPIQGGNTMGDELKTPASPAVTQEDVKRASDQAAEAAVKSESERRDAIDALAARFTGRVPKIDELRADAIKKRWTPETFKGEIADRITDSKPIDMPESEIGLTDKETKAYSFSRAIASLAGMKVDAAFELECSRAIASRLGVRPKGLLVPYEAQVRGTGDFRKHPDYLQFSRARRDLVTTSAVSASNLIQTDLLAGSFIEMLRNKMVMFQAGVRMLTGLVGNIALPRQTGAGTAVWETEATGINSESTQTYDLVSMSPNEVGAYTEISRKMLLQGTPGVEGLVQDDLATVLALAIDLAILHGSGGTQPTGVVGTSGVGSVTAAGIGWPEVVEFETDVAGGNGDVGAMSYVTNAAGVGILKTRAKESGQPVYLMGENGQMNGYPVLRTNQVSSGYLFFGVWSQILLAEWGVLDLTVNPFIKDIEGLVRVTAHQAVDVGVRHGGCFSVASDLS
jgi:HK97 family phage major capsid protein